MSRQVPQELTLRHIALLAAAPGTSPAHPSLELSKEGLPGSAPMPEEVTQLMTSRVVVEVGAECPAGDGNAQSYSCPLFVLQAASSTLRDLLLDAVDAPQPLSPSSSSPPHTTAAATGAAPGVVVPLPFLQPATFVTVALYMEHFYGLDTGGPADADPHAGQGGGPGRKSAAGLGAVVGARHPTDFHVPLLLGDLYHMSAWEHQFVIQRLLRVTEVAQWATLAEDGLWVDLIGRPSTIAGGELTRQGAASAVCFSDEQQRRCVDALIETLEAATRLGIAPLQSLCAAVLSNMLIDRSADALLSLVAKPTPAGQPARPVLTPEKKKNLLERFPWLRTTAGA